MTRGLRKTAVAKKEGNLFATLQKPVPQVLCKLESDQSAWGLILKWAVLDRMKLAWSPAQGRILCWLLGQRLPSQLNDAVPETWRVWMVPMDQMKKRGTLVIEKKLRDDLTGPMTRRLKWNDVVRQ
jgi:hypothetical protein